MRRVRSALVAVGVTVSTVVLVGSPASAEPPPAPNYVWMSAGNVIYEAGVSQTNNLTVEQVSSIKVRFTDSSVINVGPGCAPGATNKIADCSVSPNGTYHLDIYLYTKNDTVTFLGSGSQAWPTVDAGPGNDVVNFGTIGPKVAIAKGGDGADTLTSANTYQIVILSLDGGAGGDTLCGGPGSRVSYASRTVGVNVSMDGVANDGEPGEADNICATIGSLTGSPYNDSLSAASAGSKIYGGSGDDNIYGKMGADTLAGDNGVDHLYGSSGDDTLTGGAGADYLDGGLGYVDVCNNDALDIEINCES